MAEYRQLVSGLVRTLQRRKRSLIGRTRDWAPALSSAAPSLAPPSLAPPPLPAPSPPRQQPAPLPTLPFGFAPSLHAIMGAQLPRAGVRLSLGGVRSFSVATSGTPHQQASEASWRGATTVHPTAVVDPGAVLGEGVTIGPFCVVGPHVALRDGVVLHPNAHVAGHTTVEQDTTVHSFASVGAAPQDLKYRGEPSALVVGRGCTIHNFAHVCGGTAAGGGLTTIGDGCLIMSHTHVGHDCELGDGVILASGSSLAGHVRVGDGAQVSGHSCVHQRVSIGRGAFVGGASALADDLVPYGLALGNRAKLRAINLVGLRRQGAPAAERRALLRAFRYVFDLPADAHYAPLELPKLALLEERARHVVLPEFPRVTEMIRFVLGQRGVGGRSHLSTRALCRADIVAGEGAEV